MCVCRCRLSTTGGTPSVCPKTGSTSPSLTVHLCLHTALLREIGNAPPRELEVIWDSSVRIHMPTKRHNIRFPASDTNGLSQDETYFTLVDARGVETQIRFHNYDAIYAHQGLYEQLFYDRLQCHSPEKVVAILHHAMAEEPWLFNALRVLDLGAGNGMVGSELQKFGVARLVGVDISTRLPWRWGVIDPASTTTSTR